MSWRMRQEGECTGALPFWEGEVGDEGGGWGGFGASTRGSRLRWLRCVAHSAASPTRRLGLVLVGGHGVRARARQHNDHIQSIRCWIRNQNPLSAVTMLWHRA